MNQDHRLAVYGSLAPGQANHRQLDGLAGGWQPGIVRGHLVESGWGAAQGYPGLRPDPMGPEVTVQLFTSEDLPDHWERLDAFEGGEYERVPVDVDLGTYTVRAQIYALRPQP
ncbi:MAG: gamma-glutamylcyclotransferase [Phenylobacterium sp.]|uniref:gamma-glutamylcyclotransferase family protein n=1 Tax=Phenylobacterium sp. TaxID=1871053 RepID=UPI0012196CEE|nr:gamma-glutamylcyclotransferase family protein [Phenylobacterium sp.]TAJ69503.1 MAG: gamma-glutamylcyclotransferase [Phenylobacterium sp.]